MSKKNKTKELENEGVNELTNESVNTETQEEQTPSVEALQARIEELEDKNLRMMAEFDNYRRRTNKEKLELMATAGERIFKEMLPLVDDFERAVKAYPQSLPEGKDVEVQYEALKEGLNLIYQKFLSFLDKNDVHPIETEDAEFNTDEHEAVTTFAAGEDKKGKVIDCTQKGYKLGDKVIRFSKVVVGE
ncbi:MAG: nucleotide exchange factor GrpE [Paludibacteraceae bacterium]